MKTTLIAVLALLFFGLLGQYIIQREKMKVLTAQVSSLQDELASTTASARAALLRAEQALSEARAELQALKQHENARVAVREAAQVPSGGPATTGTSTVPPDLAAQLRAESAVELFANSGPLSLGEAAKAVQLIGELARNSPVPRFMETHPVVREQITMLNAAANVVLTDLQAGDAAKAESLRGPLLQSLARNASLLQVVIDRQSETPEAKAEAQKLQNLINDIKARLAGTAP